MNKKTAHSSHSQLASKTITCNIHRCKFSSQAKKHTWTKKKVDWLNAQDTPPVDLHWFFEISIRTEKKFQLELKKKFSYKLTEKNFQ